VIVACAVAVHVAYAVAVHIAYAVNINKLYIACLQCSESGRPVHISEILCVFLIAHCSLSNFSVTLLQMLLPVNHVASPSSVDTLPCVHVQCLQAYG